MSTHVTCGVCGVEFCLPSELYTARVKDGRDFYCVNGHRISYSPSENQKRITELEKQAAADERHYKRLLRDYDQITATREDLIAAIKECPGGCGWRSRRQIPRDPVAMGRGIERVKADVAEHLMTVHSARDHAPLELPERT